MSPGTAAQLFDAPPLPLDNIKLAGYFQTSQELQKNCLPKPDKPLFHEQMDQNCEELSRRIRERVGLSG